MRNQLFSVAAILFSTLILLIGNGLLGTLIPVRAHLEGFSTLAIGVVGSAYFAGFVAGCFTGPRLLARVGHKSTFAVAAGLVTASTLLQSMFMNETVWILTRALFGFASASMFMVLESWLNDRAANEMRGRIFAAYMTVNYAGLIIGQLLFATGRPKSFVLFTLSAVFYALCLIPVGLTQLPQPAPTPVPVIRPARLFRVSPVGVVGCMAVGLANGAVWTLVPVYAQGHGMAKGLLAIFMVAFTLGGALIQVPLGRLSDRLDRRIIIAGTCTLAAGVGIFIAAVGGRTTTETLLLIALYGILALPLYGLSVAHANDRIPRQSFVEASATLLLTNALASCIGPTVAAVVMGRFGSASLFYYTAAIHLSVALFTVTRLRTRAALIGGTRERFEPMAPSASPSALELDPRGPEERSVS